MNLSYLCIRLSLVCALPLSATDAADKVKKPAPKPEPAAVVEVTAPLPTEPLVTVMDPKAPRQPLPAQDGAEYLKGIPGFSVIRKGGTDGDPVLRGMAGSRLTILLDGEQILGSCGARMDPPNAYIFPESYDRISVVKAPQTVLTVPAIKRARCASSDPMSVFRRPASKVSPASWAAASGAMTRCWMPAPGWLVTGGVDNLFNRAYAEHISRSTSAIPGYVVQSIRVNEPGRTLWLKAALTVGR